MTGGPVPWAWIIATLVGGVVLRVLGYLAFHDKHFMAIPGFEDAVYQARWLEMMAGRFPEAVLPWGSPAYPYLLAFLSQILGESVSALLVMQSLVGLAIAPLIAWTLRPVLPERHCWIAAFIYAIHPLGVFFEWRLQPVVWAVALVLITTRLLFFDEGQDLRRTIGGGLLLGLGFLFRPMLFLALGVTVLVLRLRPRPGTRPAWKRCAILLGAALILPVLLCGHHAAQEEGAFNWNWSDSVFFSRTFDEDTWGTARSMTPPAWMAPQRAESIAQQGEARILSKPEMNRYFTRQGLRALLQQPVTLVGSILGRAALLISAYEIPDPVSPQHVMSSRARHLTWGLYLFPLFLALGVIGLWLLRCDRRAAMLLPPLLAVCVVNLLGVQSCSSRWPLVVLLLPVLVIGLTRLRSALTPRWLLPAALVLLVLSALDLPGAQARFGDRSEDLREEARLHVEAEDIRDATRLLREAIRVNPENPLPHADLARVMRLEELSQAARTEYEAALELDPECETALYGLAELLRAQKSFVEAESLALRLVGLHPNHPLYWNELGAIATQLQKLPQARLALTRALQIFPDYQPAQQTLAAIDQAEQQAGALLLPSELTPPNESELAQMGRLALGAAQADNAAVADSASSAGLASFPEEPFAWFVRGSVLMYLQRPAEAVTLFQRTTEAAPGRFFPTSMAVQALAAAGRLEEAKAFLLAQHELAATEMNRRKIARMGQSMGLPLTVEDE